MSKIQLNRSQKYTPYDGRERE